MDARGDLKRRKPGPWWKGERAWGRRRRRADAWLQVPATETDRPSWQAVFEAHYPAVVRHVHRLVGERAAAEDIAQETFLRLMRHPPRRGGDLGPLLRVVASRLACNYLRGEARRRRRDAWASLLQGAEPARVPEAEVHERLAVEAVLERLGARDRVALLLWAEERPYAEIAQAIGVRPGSVGTLLARAAARFRRAWGQGAPQGVAAVAVAHQLKGAETP